MAATGRGGRPHKGDRILIASRPNRVVADLVRKRADELELTISDYVAQVLAETHGVPEAGPVAARDHAQEVLPLGRTA